MSEKEKVAVAAPGKLPAEKDTSANQNSRAPAVLVADLDERVDDIDSLAHPAHEARRSQALLNAQRTYGNFYVQRAVSGYQQRNAPKVTKPEPTSGTPKSAISPPTSAATPATLADQPSPRGTPATASAAHQKLADAAKGEPGAKDAAAVPGRVVTPAPPARGVAKGGGPASAPNKDAETGTSIQAWKSGVHAATANLKTDKISAAPQVAKVHGGGGKAIDKHHAEAAKVPKDGKAAVTPAPKAEGVEPLIPPKVDPVPEATKAVEEASNKSLSAQVIPPLVESPLHNMPQIGPAPTPAPPAKDGDSAVKTDELKKPDDSAEKDPNQEKADKANAPVEKNDTGIRKGPAGEIIIEDKTSQPQPEPELPPMFKTGIAAALARLMVDPNAEADAILTQVRNTAYAGQLAQDFPDIGKSSIDSLTTDLSSELDGIRKEAGISEEEIKGTVEKRQKEVEKEKADAEAQINQTGDAEKQKLADAGKDTLSIIAGTREELDQATEDKLTQAKGENDPEVVKLKRERMIRDTQKKVAKQVVGYDQLGKKRHAEIQQIVGLQRVAYRNAVKADEEQVVKLAGSPEKAAVWPWTLQAAGSRNWGDAQLRALEQMLVDKGKETDDLVSSLQKSVHTAGQTAVEMIRTWADTKLNEHRSWWSKFWQMISDWGAQAKAESEAWETVRNKGTRDAMVGDMNFLGGVVMSAGDELSEEARKNLEKLNAEQRAIVSTYYGIGPDGKSIAGAKDAKNPIAAIAAGLRVRILQQRGPKILEQFDKELEKTPASDWRKLDRLGKSERSEFNARGVCSEVYEALHGGLTGWNDEPRVFRALANLTKVQSLAVRKLYELPVASGGYGFEKGLEWDLQDQLTGTFKSGHDWERAKAELEGDSTAADVAKLAEAMHGGLTGWGTDEKAIMETLRGKSAAERDKIKQLYFDKYHVRLEDDLKDELTGAFEDIHDYDRAKALMEGDTNRADAIAIDQAMDGPGTDRKAIEGVYKQVREDVERDLKEQHAKSHTFLTTKELEAEVKRRYEQIESSYNVAYSNYWDSKNESGLRQAYKDDLSDGELALVNAIADNDLTKADAARIQVEKESWLYADDDIINGVLKHQYERALEELKRDKGQKLHYELDQKIAEAARNHHPWDDFQIKQARHRIDSSLEQEARLQGKTYMKQLENTYDTDFGVIGKGSFRYEIERNMDGYELQEARKRVAQGGYLSPAQEIHFATEGLGTKDEMFKKALQGKTKDEIQDIRKEWARMHPGESLEDRIESETSGRLKFELMHELKGEPMTMDEEMDSKKDLVQHEREHDSWFTSDERKRMEVDYGELVDRYNDANDPNLSDEERAKRIAKFENAAGYTDVTVQEHKESLEAITNGLVTAVTTAIAVTLAAVAIIFSGGTATPAVVAALATWWGAAAAAVVTAGVGIGIRQAMLGSDYSGEDMAVDIAVGGVEAVTAAATAGLSKALFAAKAETLLASLAGKELSVAERQALLVTLEKNPAFAKGWFATMAESGSRLNRMAAHGIAGAMFGAAGSVPSGFARSILDGKTWEGGGAWEKILAGTTGGIPMGALGGGVLGMAGGIRAPHAPGKVPALDEGTRPLGDNELLPPGGKHSPDTLKEGLPPDLQKKVPIHVDPDLESNTVRVHYDVDENGVFKDIHIQAGPTATPRDIELHVPTVRTMQKYSGLQGRVRVAIAKARASMSRTGKVPSRRVLEAQLEVEKLPAVIEDRMNRLADPDLDPKVQAELEADVANLRDQLNENQRVLEGTAPEEEARGYVAAKGRKKGSAPATGEEEVGTGTAKPAKKGTGRGRRATTVSEEEVAAKPTVEGAAPKAEVEGDSPPAPTKPTETEQLQARYDTALDNVHELEIDKVGLEDQLRILENQTPEEQVAHQKAIKEKFAKGEVDFGSRREQIEELREQLAATQRQLKNAKIGVENALKAVDESNLTLYDKVRAATTGQRRPAAARVIRGAAGKDQVSGKPLAAGTKDKLTIEHIVSVKEIVNMKGFEKLPLKTQIEIVDSPENLCTMSGAANSSKSDNSWEDWTNASKYYPEPSVRNKMILREKELRILLQDKITAAAQTGQ